MLVLIVVLTGPAWSLTPYPTIQLTDNSYDDEEQQVSGNNVVWRGHDGSDYEIYLYDGNTTTQLTNNSYNDFYPQVSGDNVVWRGHDG